MHSLAQPRQRGPVHDIAFCFKNGIDFGVIPAARPCAVDEQECVGLVLLCECGGTESECENKNEIFHDFASMMVINATKLPTFTYQKIVVTSG